MKKKLAVLVATWFGSGLIPPVLTKGMAGTYGSIAALPLCWLVVHAFPGTEIFYNCVVFGIMFLGFWSVPIAEAELGPKMDWHGKLKYRDQNQIVIDEVLGMLFACVVLRLRPDLPWWWFLVSLVAFRICDIWKPFPAGFFDRQVQSELGVMMDDLFAGVWAALITAILVFLIG